MARELNGARYSVEHMPNGLYRVFDRRTKADTVLNANGTFRHGFPMEPIHIHEALKQAGFDVVPLSKWRIPTASFVPLKKAAKIAAGTAGKAVPLLGLAADFADIPEAQAGTISTDFETKKQVLARQQRDIESEEWMDELPPSGMARFAGPEGGERYAAERFGTSNGNERVENQQLMATNELLAEELGGIAESFPEEQQLMAKAQEADDAQEEAFAAAAPIGDFSKGALNSLVDSLNKVMPLFGVEDTYATFTEDIEGALPTEFVRYLMMTTAAATDANLARLAIDLEGIDTDEDLMKAAGQLEVLAETDAFRTFMAQQDTEAPVEEEVVEEEVTITSPQMTPDEAEAMLVARA